MESEEAAQQILTSSLTITLPTMTGGMRSRREHIATVNYAETRPRKSTDQVQDEKKTKAREMVQLQREKAKATDDVADIERAARQKTLKRKTQPGAVYEEDTDGPKFIRKRPSTEDGDAIACKFPRWLLVFKVTYLKLSPASQDSPHQEGNL